MEQSDRECKNTRELAAGVLIDIQPPVDVSSIYLALDGSGGALVTQKFAGEIGTDFYGSGTHGTVGKCNELLH